MLIITTNKRSQVEIIGLVIIVILISLALLFVLQFSLKQPVSVKKTYTHATIASREIDALVKSGTDCSSTDMIDVNDLLKECAAMGSFSKRCEDGLNYCEKLDETVGRILNETLIAWGKDFELTAVVEELFYRNWTNEEYVGRRDYVNVESETYPMQVPGLGIMFVTLDIYG